MPTTKANCPKCDGPATVTTRLLDRPMLRVHTEIETRCQDPECGATGTITVPGDQRG